LTRLVPFRQKSQISEVAFLLWRRIEHKIEHEAPVESILPAPKEETNTELLIRLQRIRLMERGHDVSLLDRALKRLLQGNLKTKKSPNAHSRPVTRSCRRMHENAKLACD
jgi:hypothetical protein